MPLAPDAQMAEATPGITVDTLDILAAMLQPLSEQLGALVGDPTSRLSTEMLAECFKHLPLRYLLSASHVSSSWRAAALAFPALWSQIRISWPIRDAGDLLHMAMSRAGELSVDFEYRSFYHPPSKNFISAVSHHMHRFRSIVWDASPRHLDLTARAPLLQSLVLGGHIFTLPKEFLGRAAGSLRTLRTADIRFPKVGPALTTLTELRASCPWYVSGDLGIHRVFALCPQLEILHLRNVHEWSEGALPAGPPPPTLRELTLHGRADCDLVRLYNTSSLTSVPRVRLEQPLATAYSMAPFLNGALDLSVVFEKDNNARIVVAMPSAREHTLVLYELEWASRPAIFVAKILREMQTETVRTLRVPLSVLSHLLSDTPSCDWPRVARLTVDVFASDTPVDARSNFSWQSLDCLRELSQRFPAITALLLSVHPHDDECPPQLADARALVQCLSGLGELPELHIEGFPDDIARAMAADPASPLLMVFDV